MKRTRTQELEQRIGEDVLVKGWVHEIRPQSNIVFVLLRERTDIVQVVVKKQSDAYDILRDVTRESVIQVSGTVQQAQVRHDEVTQQQIEVLASDAQILSEAQTPLPIQVVEGKNEAELSTRLDARWIDLRKPRKLRVFEIWTFMEKAMREWWDDNDFIQIYSPKLMGVPSESGAELFGIEYFGQQAYLAQSPQFYKQMAMAAGFERIFEIGPVFRANPSHTSRHDTEFTMIDMEISYVEDHEDVMQVEESWLAYLLKRLKQEYGDTIKEEFGVDVVVPETPFPRIRFEDAIKRLEDEKGHKLEGDLDSEGEKLLYELIKEEHGHDFVFVTDYPWEIRPFYHMKKGEDETRSFDLLWKGLEITTGAQREHRPEVLEQQASEKDLHLEPLEDYLNFFRYGCPPHGGFALSPTRMLMLLLGISNVREVTFLPRDTQRLRP